MHIFLSFVEFFELKFADLLTTCIRQFCARKQEQNL